MSILSELKFSCVVDTKTIYQAQAYIWASILINHLKINPSNIYIHLVGNSFSPAFTEWLEHIGVRAIWVEPFDSRSPYLNKLQQLPTFSQLGIKGHVVFMDCDTAIYSLEGLSLESEISAKIVDFPQPSLLNLGAIYDRAGLGKPQPTETTFSLADEKLTDRYNCNGGVIFVSIEKVSAIESEWKRYANWCLENIELFEEKSQYHVDQVSFGMALRNLELEIDYLGLEWNYPIHVDKELLPPSIEPRILHYHRRLDRSLRIEKLGVKKVDSVIQELNEVIARSFQDSFNNQVFWDHRYSVDPDFGSGVGSRGEVLAYKRRLLQSILSQHKDLSILDVGCGDIETTRELAFSNYTGIDLSAEAIRIAREKRPEWSFEIGKLQDLNLGSFDVVICLDVLIHQQTKQSFFDLLDTLIDSCKGKLVLGAYNEIPIFESSITFFYMPIVEALKSRGVFEKIEIVGKYRDVTLVAAQKRKETCEVLDLSHARDISNSELLQAYPLCPESGLLTELIDLSRLHLGFFTSQFTRSIEYPWVASKLRLGGGSKTVLDVGAGLSPLPFYFAKHSAKMYTVDRHAKVRTLRTRESWNEWGFLDYSALDDRIKSNNVDILKFRCSRKFDYVYSVSVIEHLPAAARRKILKHLRKLMGGNGSTLLLTVDLVPETDLLWNRSEGRQVDLESEHGSVDNLIDELRCLGFSIESQEIVDKIPNSRTDVLFVEAKLNKGNSEKVADKLEAIISKSMSWVLKTFARAVRKLKQTFVRST